jgi:hypothetical protein
LQHFKDWEEAILGVDTLNKWWDFKFREKEFNKGSNAELLFAWASLGYFFKFTNLYSGEINNSKVQ